MSKRKMQQELFEACKVQEYEQDLARRRAAQAAGSPEAPAAAGGQGILPFVVKGEPDEDQITGRAGLVLVVEALRAYDADALIRSHLKVKQRDRGYDEVAMIEAFALLQASGGEHLEDLVVLREDGGLCRLLDRELPSPDVARVFLLHFNDNDLIDAARKAAEAAGEKSFVPEENPPLQALGKILAKVTRRMADPEISRCATLDHDATIIDSQKQTATWHYKGGKGYQPVAIYWAEQDLVVADEFRDGNVPAAKDNLRLIMRGFQSLPDWVTERNFRADSACYDERVLKWLANPKRKGGPAGTIGFTISADMTKELLAVCKQVKEPDPTLAAEVAQWKLLDDTRPHETVEWAEVEFTPGEWPKDAWPLRYVAMRFTKRQGNLFASGERFKYLAVVTNRTEPGDEILHWHWKKAGTIEHVHDDTKNGLGAGVLPCGEFGANAAWYRLTMLTYNVLTVIKRKTLPAEQLRAKPKRLRFLVFDMAARLTRHARYLYAHIKQAALERTYFVAARAVFLALSRDPPWLPDG